jgi:hypothetical protein
MYAGLALVINAITFALSLTMLAPQGMWLWLIGLVVSTGMMVYILPMIQLKNDE